jgi:hypothetical protein
MRNLFYLIAVLLVAIWIIIVTEFHPFGLIHVLLVLAGFSIAIGIFFKKKLLKNKK